jgi:hypothetical protein
MIKKLSLIRCNQPKHVRCTFRSVSYYMINNNVIVYHSCGEITGLKPIDKCRFAQNFNPLDNRKKLTEML